MAKKNPTRGQLKRRANRQANAANSPQQAAINRARKSAQRTYKTEVGAARGAKRATISMLNAAANDIPGRLRGRTLGQVEDELAARMDATQGMVKYAKVGARQDLRSSLADIREQQAALDAATAQDAQSILQDSLQRQREKDAAARKKRTDYEREIQAALAEIRQQVAKTRGPGGTALNIERANLRADGSLRRNLVDYLTTSQGISIPAAKKALSMFTRGKNTAFDTAGMAATGVRSAIGGGMTARPGFADAVAAAAAEPWWEKKK